MDKEQNYGDITSAPMVHLFKIASGFHNLKNQWDRVQYCLVGGELS